MTQTQNDLILEHLKEHGTINPLQALELYGSFRLSARILDLRQDGHNIETIEEYLVKILHKVT